MKELNDLMQLSPKRFKLLVFAMILTTVSFLVIVVLLDAVAPVLHAFDSLYLLVGLVMRLIFIALLVLLVVMSIYCPIDWLLRKWKFYRWKKQQYLADRVEFAMNAQELCFSGLATAIFQPFRSRVAQKLFSAALEETISVWIRDLWDSHASSDKMKRMDKLKWRYRCLQMQMANERSICLSRKR